jgi:hypothetical protein
MKRLAIALCLVAGGCATSHPKLVDRQPDASLLLSCERPAPPPAKPTDNDIALVLIDAVQKYLACEARHAALAAFVKGEPKLGGNRE